MNAAPGTSRLDSLYAGFLARPHQLFIGGKWVAAQSGETFAVVDPSTGREIAQCAAGGAADVDLAVKAARKAFHSGPWPSMSHAERGKLMLKLAEAVERNADELDRLASLANDTAYGLAANIWTRDLAVAHGLARRIQAGTITINGGGREQPMPFGGFKQSGLGREGGREGIEAYTEMKTVSIGFG